MRGEPNTIGIRVKKAPLIGKAVYYTDKEFSQNTFRINMDLGKVYCELNKGKTIIIPSDGIGTGLAKLKQFAPKTLKYLQEQLRKMTERYNK